jgi:hypothetical protein
VDEQVCRYAGADSWSTDAMEGVRICLRLVGGPKASEHSIADSREGGLLL